MKTGVIILLAILEVIIILFALIGIAFTLVFSDDIKNALQIPRWRTIRTSNNKSRISNNNN